MFTNSNNQNSNNNAADVDLGGLAPELRVRLAEEARDQVEAVVRGSLRLLR